MKKRLYLIDASGFIFRAFYALPRLTRSDGTPTGAVYGFVSMMLKLLVASRQSPVASVAVIFDAGRKSFRNELYPAYKANRDETPPELVPQFALVREATEAMGLAGVELAGFEADDLIASYARAGAAAGHEVVIVSSDKDLMQLVDESTGITMFDAMKDKSIGTPEVTEKFGVGPQKVGEVLALMGDSSDNIPGVPGIGPKTAAELILEYGDVETLLARAGEIKQNKRRESIIENAEKARLSRVLVSLKEDIPLPLPLESCAYRGLAEDSLREFLRRMEFRKLEERLNKPLPAEEEGLPHPSRTLSSPTSPGGRGEIVNTEPALLALLAQIREEGQVAISGLWEGKSLIGMALALEGVAAYVPVGHRRPEAGSRKSDDLFADQGLAEGQLPLHLLEKHLLPLLADPSILKLTAEGKETMKGIENSFPSKCGAALAVGVWGPLRPPFKLNPFDDVCLLSYVLEAGLHGHALEDLAEIPSANLGTGRNKTSPAQMKPEDFASIAGARAAAIYRLWHQLKPKLFEQRLLTVYERMERPLVPVLAAMENIGIKVDVAKLRGLSDEFNGILRGLEQEIYALAQGEFLIGSPKQLGEVLFEKLGLPGGKKSKKSGQYGTGVEVLEDLAAQGHVIAEKVLEWRQYDKLRSTYTEALERQINPATGRVHTTFQQAVAATGRLSSTDPNLQNIPIRTAAGKRIREAFVAGEGYELISADYSQIELRLLAEMTDIPVLKAAFKDGQDIHAATASQMFGVPVEEVTPELRRRAKTINFGIIYGISAHGLAVRLGIDRAVAAEFIEAYFKHYPGIKNYMEAKKDEARRHGFITTLYGRRVHIAGIHDSNFMRRSFAERQAINAPLQGTAADIIKRAMLALESSVASRQSPVRMILQVHDELLFEAPEGQGTILAPQIKKIMESAANLSLPLTVEVSIGKNWGEIH